MWSYEQNYLLSTECYIIWIIMFTTQTLLTKTTMICTAWKSALRKYKHLNILFSNSIWSCHVSGSWILDFSEFLQFSPTNHHSTPAPQTV
jgi:hypothetical protein